MQYSIHTSGTTGLYTRDYSEKLWFPLNEIHQPQLLRVNQGKPQLQIKQLMGRAGAHVSLECSRFSFLTFVALKLLVSLISRLVACGARIVVEKQTCRQTDRQTERQTTVTLAVHAGRGLIIMHDLCDYCMHTNHGSLMIHD